MATSTDIAHCVICDKANSTLRCGGCLQEFCFKHLIDHRKELNQQLEKIEVDRDLFKQSLSEQMKDSKNHSSLQQINKWEFDSIEKIKKTAEDARLLLVKHVSGNINQIEVNLNKLTDQLRKAREEDDFNEKNLHQFEEELTKLKTELSKPSDVSIQQNTSSVINNIYADAPGKNANFILIDRHAEFIMNKRSDRKVRLNLQN